MSLARVAPFALPLIREAQKMPCRDQIFVLLEQATQRFNRALVIALLVKLNAAPEFIRDVRRRSFLLRESCRARAVEITLRADYQRETKGERKKSATYRHKGF